jgi:hypothetical protein
LPSGGVDGEVAGQGGAVVDSHGDDASTVGVEIDAVGRDAASDVHAGVLGEAAADGPLEERP